MIEGKYEDTSVGTPQGGLISPILANVYLHYVLDLWFEKCIKKQLYGEAYLVRFADDFLIMFQYERDAQRVYEAVIKEWNFLDWNCPRKRHEYFRLEDTVVQEKHLIF
ncbi:hypothetical protein KTQ83_10650 [Holdemanella porci]|nr:reverse transcriptase domain-containing protein [Holdemanella porci]MBU9131075.1 hypothetical protein [Holdemanella porci]MBU9887966.1 hypothetical protein [Holdemanella porci]